MIENLDDLSPDEIALELFRLQKYSTYIARRKIKPPKGYAVMHINGNPYDNSLENLRVVARGD